MDTSISVEQKTKYMIEWWSSSQQAIVDSKALYEKDLIHTVVSSAVQLRDHSHSMLKDLNKDQVPFLVFSAGCGDVVRIVLENKENSWYEDTMMLVSNMLGFHEDGLLKEFKEPLIHTNNKSDFVKRIKDSNSANSERIQKLVDGRSNIILLGDHLGDLRMAEGVENIDNL